VYLKPVWADRWNIEQNVDQNVERNVDRDSEYRMESLNRAFLLIPSSYMYQSEIESNAKLKWEGDEIRRETDRKSMGDRREQNYRSKMT